MKARYAFVIQDLKGLGGTERSACAVMNGLVRQGCDVRLVELVGAGAAAFPLSPEIAVSSLFNRPVKIFNSWFRIVWRLSRLLKREKIDTLVVVESTHALYGVAAARLAGVRCVVWEHFNFNVTLNRRKRVWGRQIAARWADDVVVLTQRDTALWREGTTVRARLTAIPNMAPRVTDRPYPEASRLVLAAGRLTEQKGYDLLLRAWRIVEQDPRSAGWELLIRGDGPDRDVLLQQAEGLHHVTIAAATGGIDADYARAALFVASSRYEGLPMVLLEAMSAGVPVVAFDCETGPAEIVRDGETGFLVPPEEPEALAIALLELMGAPEQRQSMSAKARQRAAEFQEGPVMARWKALLQHTSG
ncbi:glycosyltransferase family 4 protein [Gluconobacter oxydans]|uniref:glycosyltransferase family 4 protein n=1 Tax=Gluconobacter oxydans TaxID=442 RepID=UPI000785DA46|nr:glycosyltransferase family 4 protein [Gluconobacter oxydans]KXV12408.1 lipopolysaccharide biosynthesis protein [Gluconobacter oxydans]MCP1247708.1 glycosyltransferase family 4 protein [Gluconobacter oxydans]WKE48782.1 glycosyltransferase family 4 protein [Gluconobacter oxydans]